MVCLAVLATSLVALLPGVAFGSAEDYPAPYRIFWKPTEIDLSTTEISAQNHAVYESFRWTKTFSNDKVGPPRTPSGDNTFEAEMRFRQLPNVSNTNHWCERGGGSWSVVNNFPGDFYEDAFQGDDSSHDEFTWGFRSAVPGINTTYFLGFHCQPNQGVSETDTFTWGAQIGHCHTPCTVYTTFADETVTFVPKRASHEGSFNPSVTLGGNPGFEGGLGNWVIDNDGAGTAHVCNNPNPFEGSCYMFLRPANTSLPITLRYIYTPANSFIAQGETYNEFEVRCPTQWNNGDCDVKAAIVGFDANNNATGAEELSAWKTVPEDDTNWYGVRLELTGGNTRWPSNTEKWRFKLQVAAGDTVDVDWHQQWYGDFE